MAVEGLDALVISGSSIIDGYAYLAFATGFVPATKTAWAILRNGEKPVLFVPSEADRATFLGGEEVEVRVTHEADARPVCAVVEAAARELALSQPTRVGVAGLRQFVTVGEHAILQHELPGVELVDSTSLLARVKARKTQHDVARLREAVELVVAGLDVAEALLRPGTPAQRVIAAVERVLRENGAWRTMVYVDSGTHYARLTTDAVIERHRLTTVLVEAVSPSGYWAEIGDVFSIGPPRGSDLQLAVACHDALSAIRDALIPGTPASEPIRILEEAGRAHGLALGRGIGHGVGVGHDRPSLGVASTDVIEVGHALAIHPNLYSEAAQIGVSVCDTVLVTDAGAVSLSRREPGLRVLDT